MRKRVVTDAIRDEILSLYAAYSLDQIAAEVGVSYGSVHRAIKDSGLQFRSQGGSRPGPRPQQALLTAEQVAEVRDLNAGGMTQTALAGRYDVSRYVIGRVVRRQGAYAVM